MMGGPRSQACCQGWAMLRARGIWMKIYDMMGEGLPRRGGEAGPGEGGSVSCAIRVPLAFFGIS